MIPNCALAAMLISVGIRLAHPKEFIHSYHIGPEQLAIFITTIFFTLFEDLLVGIAAGMLLKLIIHIIKGAPLSALFKAPINIDNEGDYVNVTIEKAAIFSNFIGIKRQLEEIPSGKSVRIDLSNTALVDHSVMENLHLFKRDYGKNGGSVTIEGLDNHKTSSTHDMAARKNSKFTK